MIFYTKLPGQKCVFLKFITLLVKFSPTFKLIYTLKLLNTCYFEITLPFNIFLNNNFI